MGKICNLGMQFEATQAIDLLKKSGINAYISEPGAGAYMNVFMGKSLTGYDIVVEDKDETSAIQILTQTGIMREESDQSDDCDDENADILKKLNRRKLGARIVTWSIILISVLLAVISKLVG